ncbi:MAG: DUF1934 domain-containing protein [Clostridia bacterium]|nr:DUF1934 domain-containing protein [Clostridia bacterium]
MLKRVRVSVKTKQWQLGGTIFDDVTPPSAAPARVEPQEIEMTAEGSYHDDGHRVTVTYREGELSGLGNAKTTIFFQKSDPHTVTMTRDGAVRTALLFEEGKRHICIYKTPLMPFEVAVKTRRVENTLSENGKLRLDYTVEIKGADPERTELTLSLLPDIRKPLSSS